MKKTNAARLLDRLGIDYELLEYRVDEQDLSAEHVAQELDLPAEQVSRLLCCGVTRLACSCAVFQETVSST